MNKVGDILGPRRGALAVLPFLIGLLAAASVNAQCTEVYIFRTVSMVSTVAPLELYVGSERVGGLPPGSRYRMHVCGEGRDVPMEVVYPDLGFNSRAELIVGDAPAYYFKAGVTPGVSVPYFNAIDEKKAAKLLGSNTKFRYGLQTFDLGEDGSVSLTGEDRGLRGAQPGATASAVSVGDGPAAAPVGSFARQYTAKGFRYEITDVVRTGDALDFRFLLTNQTGNDRVLTLAPHQIYFYDSNGNFKGANEVCIGQSCRRGSPLDKPSDASTRGEAHPAYFGVLKVNAPAGIPIRGHFTIPNLDATAQNFLRGQLIAAHHAASSPQAREVMVLDFGELALPSSAPEEAATVRNWRGGTIELLGVEREGTQLLASFRVVASVPDAPGLSIASASAYSAGGRQFIPVKVGFAGRETRFTGGRLYRRDFSIEQGVDEWLTLSFDAGEAPAERLARLSIDAGDYRLQWDDIPVGGDAPAATPPAELEPAAAPPADDAYLTYESFDREAAGAGELTGKKVVLDHLYFDTGSATLLPASHEQLDDLAALLAANPALRIEIAGHTDDQGSAASNVLLSQKRADEVRYYLIGKSIPPNRMTSIGYGQERPLAVGLGPQRVNRRVEIEVQ